MGAMTKRNLKRGLEDLNSQTTINACRTHYVCARYQSLEGDSIHLLLYLTICYLSLLQMGHLSYKAECDKDCAHWQNYVQTDSAGSDLYYLSKQIWQEIEDKKGRIRT